MPVLLPGQPILSRVGVLQPVVAAGGGTDPPGILGADLWSWHKDTGLAGVDNDPLGQWDDASGNARHMTQGTAAQKPTKKTAIANGLAVARFDATDDNFAVPNMSALTAGTAWVVVKLTNDPPLAGATSGFWNIGSDTQNVHVPFTDGTIYDDYGSTTRHATANPATSMSATFVVYSAYSAASAWRNFVNNTGVVAEIATNTVGFLAAPTFGMNASAQFLSGDVAEVVFASAKATAGQLTDMQTYFASRFAL